MSDNFKQLDEVLDDHYTYTEVTQGLPPYVNYMTVFEVPGNRFFGVRTISNVSHEIFKNAQGDEVWISQINPQNNRPVNNKTPVPNPKKFLATIINILQKYIDENPVGKNKKAFVLMIPEDIMNQMEKFVIAVLKRKFVSWAGEIYKDPTVRTEGRGVGCYSLFVIKRGSDITQMLKPKATVPQQFFSFQQQQQQQNTAPSQQQPTVIKTASTSVQTPVTQTMTVTQTNNEKQAKIAATALFEECFVGMYVLFSLGVTSLSKYFSIEGSTQLKRIGQTNTDVAKSVLTLSKAYGIQESDLIAITKFMYIMKSSDEKTVIDMDKFHAMLATVVDKYEPSHAMKEFATNKSASAKDFVDAIARVASTSHFKDAYAEYQKILTTPKAVTEVKGQELIDFLNEFMITAFMNDTAQEMVIEKWETIWNNKIENINFDYSSVNLDSHGIYWEKFRSFSVIAKIIPANKAEFVAVLEKMDSQDMKFLSSNLESLTELKPFNSVMLSSRAVVFSIMAGEVRLLINSQNDIKAKTTILAGYLNASYKQVGVTLYENIIKNLNEFDFDMLVQFFKRVINGEVFGTNTTISMVALLKSSLTKEQQLKLNLIAAAADDELGMYSKFNISRDDAAAIYAEIKNSLDRPIYYRYNTMSVVYATMASRVSKIDAYGYICDLLERMQKNYPNYIPDSFIGDVIKHVFDSFSKESDEDIKSAIDICYSYVKGSGKYDTLEGVLFMLFYNLFKSNSEDKFHKANELFDEYSSVLLAVTSRSLPLTEMFIFDRLSGKNVLKAYSGDFSKNAVKSDYTYGFNLLSYRFVEFINKISELYPNHKSFYAAMNNPFTEEKLCSMFKDMESSGYDVTPKNINESLLKYINDKFFDLSQNDYTDRLDNSTISEWAKIYNGDVNLALDLMGQGGYSSFKPHDAFVSDKFKKTFVEMNIDDQVNLVNKFISGQSYSYRSGRSKTIELDDMIPVLNSIGSDDTETTDTILDVLEHMISNKIQYDTSIDIDCAKRTIDKFEDISSQRFKDIVIHSQFKTLNTMDKDWRKTRQYYENITSNIDLDNMSPQVQSLIDDFAQTYGTARIKDLFLKDLIFQAYKEDLVNSPIKPLVPMTPVDIRKVLQFNNIDVSDAVTDLQIRKLKNESYPDMLKRTVNNLKGASIRLPEIKVAARSEDEDTLEKRSIAYTKYRNENHGSNTLRFLKTYDCDIKFPEYDQFKRDHKDDVIKIPMFSGTGSVPATMILRTGFVVASSSHMRKLGLKYAGRMFGDGIYVTDTIDKAQQYVGDVGYTRAPGTRGYLLELEVQLGKLAGTGYGLIGNQAGLRYDPDADSAAGGVRHANYHMVRSPEWVVKNPKAQIRIYKVHEVVIVSSDHMNRLKQKHGSNITENVIDESKFDFPSLEDYINKVLKEENSADDMSFNKPNTSIPKKKFKDFIAITFEDGLIPLSATKTVEVSDYKLKDGMEWDYSDHGYVICYPNNEGYNGSIVIPNTQKLLSNDEEGILPMLFKILN